VGVLLVASAGALACATAGPKAEAPAGAPASTEAAPEREPATLAEAEAMLERYRSDIDQLALNTPGTPSVAAGAAAPADAAPPAAAPPAPQQAPSRAAERDEHAEKSSSAPEPSEPRAQNACETACKAFSSLSRAKDAVCRLDTEGGQRCERAKKIREDAAQRVAGCGCS
jgi:hypothetical protein